MSANTAIHIVAFPNNASAKNMALIPNASVMFCQSTVWVCRDNRMALGIRRRSSFMITMSAASIAP